MRRGAFTNNIIVLTWVGVGILIIAIVIEFRIREEMDYRFDIILYTHRIFQMFEFPAMDILASKNKTR